MLARERRLRRPADIAKVYRRGRSTGGSWLYLRTLAAGWPETRVAIVVPKKVSKSAVVRNRIRRRIAGVLAELWPKTHPGYDIVISITGAEAADLPAAQINHQLSDLLTRAGVL